MPGAHSKRRTLRSSSKAIGWAVVVIAVLSVIGLLLVGANGPDDPTLAGVAGFGETAFQVAPAGGGTAGRYCALLADTEERRAKGLMGRRDLAGFDAMVFVFDTESTGGFFMRNVPVDLSIAWFGADGRFVAAADMAPCPDRDGCPTYAPPAPYRQAVEVLQGDLAKLGISEGSVLTVGGACRR